MTDIPIIFSAPMVVALLAGRKTMTRRLAWRDQTEKQEAADIRSGCHPHLLPSLWQRVKPGDRLWVRENLCTMGNWGLWHDATPAPKQGQFLDDLDPRGRAILDKYAPTEATDSALVPSIYMPRWASRLTLVVTATKIERLCEITEVDAEAEGVELPKHMSSLDRGAYRHCFHVLWCTLHGKGPADPAPWVANPDVVALTFTVHKQNIDTLPSAAAA